MNRDDAKYAKTRQLHAATKCETIDLEVRTPHGLLNACFLFSPRPSRRRGSNCIVTSQDAHVV
jgi:hypothetical protein